MDSHFIALLIYVDDVLIAGDDIEFIQSTKAALDKKFTIKDLACLKYFLDL